MYSLLYFLFSIILLVQSSPVPEHPLARFWVFTCTGPLGSQQERCNQQIKRCIGVNCFDENCEICLLDVEPLCKACANDIKSFVVTPFNDNGQIKSTLTDMDNNCIPDYAHVCMFGCHRRVGTDGSCKSYPVAPRSRCICDPSTPIIITNPFPEFLSEVNGINLITLTGFTSARWSLLYQGSRDGFSSSDFHAKCDNKGKTLTIVKSANNTIFGGYTEQTWDSTNTYKKDPSAFIFSLVNRNNNAYRFNIKSSSTEAIFCQQSSGPKFGGQNHFDIAISHESNSNSASFSELGSNYNILGQLPADFETESFLGGSYQFTVLDIAVYQML